MSLPHFDNYPEFGTDRLRLRKPTLDDARALALIYGHPETSRYIPYPAAVGIATVQERLTQNLESARRGEGFRWILCEHGHDEPVGTAGLFQWSKADRRAEVGYVVSISQCGRGLMKELMPALLRFGFEEMKLHRIEAHVDPDNTASIRVLTRVGFQQEGVLRDNVADGESFRDTVMFSLLEGEWRKTG
ncbi:GNAT family N-acetyltransferase [Pyxidicoccus trucidator]|uniref:GNAT family N-acetyltransferase n=1 Tax=Pyxidicoccus trucidator TaxID=2709662 RepID=UPI0013DC241A|nr:GNAT family protein [Pyxidicoccus trucidator]